jgi:hypothetical protein
MGQVRLIERVAAPCRDDTKIARGEFSEHMPADKSGCAGDGDFGHEKAASSLKWRLRIGNT